MIFFCLILEYYDRVDGDLSMSFGGLDGRGRKKQDPPIERDLYLSLEEVFHGCTKKMKISRRVSMGHIKSSVVTLSSIPVLFFPLHITYNIVFLSMKFQNTLHIKFDPYDL